MRNPVSDMISMTNPARMRIAIRTTGFCLVVLSGVLWGVAKMASSTSPGTVVSSPGVLVSAVSGDGASVSFCSCAGKGVLMNP